MSYCLKNKFDHFLSFLAKGLEFMIGVMMVTLTGVTFLQVIMRYVFNSPTSWSSELSRFLLVWITLTGASVVTRYTAHLSMGFSLHRFIKPSVARCVTAFMNTCITVAMMIICWYSYRIMVVTGGAISPGLHIPMYVPWAALPVNSIIMCLFLIGDLFKIFERREED